MNTGNTLRQRVADMLVQNEKLPGGYSPDELAQMKRVVEGSPTGNIARYAGNMLGGGVAATPPPHGAHCRAAATRRR